QSLFLCHPPPTPPCFPYTTLFRSVRPRPQRSSLPSDSRRVRRSLAWSSSSAKISSSMRRVVGSSVPRNRTISEYDSMTIRMLERSEEHTSELQSPYDLVCRLLLEK